MYHYVRTAPEGLPYFRYLHVDDFRKQLDFLAQTDRFISKNEFAAILKSGTAPKDGIILTFDDATKDHVDYVVPELKKRGLWGIFYVPTGMYETGKMLDVHRIHYLMGKYGGVTILEKLNDMVVPEMIQKDKYAEFKEKTYPHQDNDAATMEAKRILNYYLLYEYREKILDDLMRENGDEAAFVHEYYVTPDEMVSMSENGMTIGSHTVTHPVLSKLSVAEQKAEIINSFAYLEKVTGGLDLKTFCYPYGRSVTYTQETKNILSEIGCDFTFAVEHRDITDADIRENVQALPRWDCNQFPHGVARQG